MSFRSAFIAAAFFLSGAAPAFADSGDLGRLMRADANNDGAITRAEANEARAAMFNRLDQNGDGSISAEERQRLSRFAGRAVERLAEADSNNDGAISRAEFLGQPYALFERYDANRNDVLEQSELAAARAQAAR